MTEGASPQQIADRLAMKRRALRAIAAFEALKGIVALAAVVGLLSLLHHDIRHIAESLISHVGLDPGSRYPALLLQGVGVLEDTKLQSLLPIVSGYVLLRWVEAWALWHERSWGEWLAAVSGMLYVPFELRHLLHRPSIAGGVVLASNLMVVGFLAWQLWRERRHPDEKLPA